MSPNLELRSPTVLTAIGGIAATLVLTLLVVIALLLWGGDGAKAVSDNAALIGALVALGGVFTAQMVSIALDDRRTQESRQLEAQRTREAALQNYFEQVGTFLIEQPLHRARPGDDLSAVVRAQTLTVLEGLDPERKRILLQFLYEAGLIHKDKPVISLVLANLSEANLGRVALHRANLSGATLKGADLKQASMLDAHLQGANLKGTNLYGANLQGANLQRAYLREAYLREALLPGANLEGAVLREADLQQDNLKGAFLEEADLQDANLFGAILKGAMLKRAAHLQAAQIDWAIGDETTTLPVGLVRPVAWSKSIEEQAEILEQWRPQLQRWWD